jgi:glycosyltransferase involved in cell wall biosynthesis
MGHEITMLAFDRQETTEFGGLEEYCDLLRVPHSSKNTLRGVFWNLFSFLPYNISKYHSEPFQYALKKLLKENSFDVIHIENLHMAQYLEICRSFSEQNVESVIVERYLHVSRGIKARYLTIMHRRIVLYESSAIAKVDCCCPITDVDRDRLRVMQPSANLITIPAGVDDSLLDGPFNPQHIRHSIVFFGGLEWIPNQDGIKWFIREILPMVESKGFPDVKLVVIGKNPPAEIRSLANTRIEVLGYVEDLRSEVQKYSVAIAPHRIGGGLRLKIIESFAMKIPVVSTSIGCEGIDAASGVHLLIEDEPEKFAGAIVSLFDNQSLRQRLTEEAFKLVSEKYRWKSIARHLEEVYDAAITARRSRNDRP